jgi:hypothetical protein
MKKLAFIFLSLLFVRITYAGNNPTFDSAREDFKKTNDTYARTPNFSMDTYYMVYADHESQSTIEGKNGKYIKYGSSVYTKIDDIEIITLDNKLISINQDLKMITVGDNKPMEINPIQGNLDSLLDMCSDIKLTKLGEYERKYSLHFNDGGYSEFSRIDVTIDTKNHRYLKITLYYNISMNLKKDFYAEEKQPRLEVLYKNFRALEVDPGIFKEELYVQSVNEKLKPSSKYFNYRVSDLRNETRIKYPKSK